MASPSNSSDLELPSVHDDDRIEMLHPETNPNPNLAQHVTILMPEAVTSDDHRQVLPGSSLRAANGFILPIDAGDPTGNAAEDLTIAIVGDLPPHLAEDNRPGDEAESLAEMPVDDAAAEVPRTVELGWGIVVGEISREDFNEILSFPKLLDI